MRSVLLVGGIWLSLILGCVNPSDSRYSRPRNASTPALTHGDTTIKQSGWGYSEYADEMGRGRVYVNMIESTNTISLDSPYQGAQHGTLALREHPQYGKNVYISIEKGQLLDSDFHSKVLVRFDNDKPVSFPSVRPADLSSETLFLRGNAFSVFLNRLKTAKKLKIEVPVYQAGNQVLEFDVEGFTWKEAKRK